MSSDLLSRFCHASDVFIASQYDDGLKSLIRDEDNQSCEETLKFEIL